MTTGWYTFALASALFSAFAAITEKKTLFRESALTFSLFLALFNLLFSLPFFFLVDYSALHVSGLMVLFIKSILGAISFLCVMKALKDLEISLALPLLVLTPGLVAIFAFIFLGEALNPYQVVGIILLIAGTYTLQLNPNESFVQPERSFFKHHAYYYIVTALVLFTVTSVLDKALLKNFSVSPNAFLAFEHLFYAIFFLVVVLIYSPKKIKPQFSSSLKLIALVAAFTLVYRYTQILAVRAAPVALVLALKRISVFIAVVIGGTLFRDHNLVVRTIATVLMIVGAVLVIAF